MKRILLAATIAASSALGVLGPPTPAGAASSSGYLMVSADGTVYPFGSAPFCGHSAMVFSRAVTDVEITPNGEGYWVLIDGGYVDFIDCDMPTDDWLKYEHNNNVSLRDGESAVSLSALPDGSGYWVFTDRGRAISFGNAQFYGDMGNVALNGPVLGSVATPSGKGYWMVASDGGIFAFGDAKFYGSTGDLVLNQPVMSMAPDPDGVGYWLVASDGGIFAFEAPFKGSMGGTPLNKPVSGMVPGSDGYLMVAQDGGIFSFGNVEFHGSLGATPPGSSVVAVSLWTADIGFQPAQPQPQPEPVYEWVAVDLDGDPEFTVTGGYSEGQSIPFTIEGTSQQAFYSCYDEGTYSYGCSFTVYRYSDGGWEDGWMPEAFSTSASDGKTRNLHLSPGTYYVEGDTYGDLTFWGIGISDYRCVANC